MWVVTPRDLSEIDGICWRDMGADPSSYKLGTRWLPWLLWNHRPEGVALWWNSVMQRSQWTPRDIPWPWSSKATQQVNKRQNPPQGIWPQALNSSSLSCWHGPPWTPEILRESKVWPGSCPFWCWLPTILVQSWWQFQPGPGHTLKHSPCQWGTFIRNADSRFCLQSSRCHWKVGLLQWVTVNWVSRAEEPGNKTSWGFASMKPNCRIAIPGKKA